MKNKLAKFVGTAVTALALTVAAPVVGLAEEHGGHGYSGGHYERGHSEGYNRGEHREYREDHREYRGGNYRGGGYYYGGPSVYLSTPYAYGYNNSCGYYDRYGYWHADPYCSAPY